MSINMDKDKSIPIDIDTDAYYAYYEKLASQEELYLEETDEEVRLILVSYDSCESHNGRSTIPESCGEREPGLEAAGSMTDKKNNPRIAESLDKLLDDAAEELIIGDADDPPLSEEAVEETLRMTSNARRLKPDQYNL